MKEIEKKTVPWPKIVDKKENPTASENTRIVYGVVPSANASPRLCGGASACNVITRTNHIKVVPGHAI